MSKDIFIGLKISENGLIIIAISIISIILLPSLYIIFDNSFKSSAQTSTIETIEMVKDLYTSINLVDEVNLPFKVVYSNNNYTIYSNNKKYTPSKSVKVDVNGKMPTSGSVTIKTDGTAEVNKLKFGLYKCSQKKEVKPVCTNK